VTPKTTPDVGTVLKILTRQNAPFTVKSGGHVPFSGGSSIENGVTVDLVHINGVDVSADRKTVSVGPGNRWLNVTEKLDPLRLAVVGGRDQNVGVSGLLLGGGISFFSGIYGWACDNVRRYEVVLASGNVVYASPNENRDLYWALRGGGGLNYGIVTRFDLAAFDQGDLWLHMLSFPGTENRTIITGFQNLTIEGLPRDPAAHSVLGVASDPFTGVTTATLTFLHADVPSPPGSVPAVFQPFESLPKALATSSSTGSVSKYLTLLATPYGGRRDWGNLIISANFSQVVLDEIMSLYAKRNAALIKHGGGDTIAPLALLQAIPVNVLAQMQKNGGNPFGLRPSDGPLIMVSFPISWTNPANDKLVMDSTKKLLADVAAMAKKHGVYNPYIYMNYADLSQQVQKSYGAENYKRLKKVAKKYDPEGKLAKLWGGYFKL
jgi:hypothetical protein